MSEQYDEKIEAAKRWLGERYLLAQPINKPKQTSQPKQRKLENA